MQVRLDTTLVLNSKHLTNLKSLARGKPSSLFVPGKHFQPNLMFGSKAKARHVLNSKHWTYLKSLARGNPCSLFVPGKPSQPSLMFASKAGANPCTKQQTLDLIKNSSQG